MTTAHAEVEEASPEVEGRQRSEPRGEGGKRDNLHWRLYVRSPEGYSTVSEIPGADPDKVAAFVTKASEAPQRRAPTRTEIDEILKQYSEGDPTAGGMATGEPEAD